MKTTTHTVHLHRGIAATILSTLGLHGMADKLLGFRETYNSKCQPTSFTIVHSHRTPSLVDGPQSLWFE